MRKLIALRGAGNRGKSQTIRRVYELLVAKRPDAVQTHVSIRVDVRVILTIDGVKIGIESQGDPGSRLWRSLELFQREACKVIVSATRTAGSTVEAVEQLAVGYEIRWIPQRPCSTRDLQDARNEETARLIAGEVEAAIAHNSTLHPAAASGRG